MQFIFDSYVQDSIEKLAVIYIQKWSYDRKFTRHHVQALF